MKKVLLIAVLGLFIMSPAVVQAKEFQVGLGGSAVLGANQDLNITPDDVLVRASLGYTLTPQITVGLAMTQPTQDQQLFGIFAKGFSDSNEDNFVRFFARLDVGTLSTLDNNRFQTALGLGAQLKDVISSIDIVGRLSDVADFNSGDLTAAQLADVEMLFSFK